MQPHIGKIVQPHIGKIEQARIGKIEQAIDKLEYLRTCTRCAMKEMLCRVFPVSRRVVETCA